MKRRDNALPRGQIVLTLQGGGALGAYQVGVYEALHEAGIEPDWIIGTSIGAINAALIAGNPPQRRLERLLAFWQRVEQRRRGNALWSIWGLAGAAAGLSTVMQGIPSFFVPNPMAWGALQARIGVEQAAYYRTEPLRETLAELVDFERIADGTTRLTVGAVNAVSGQMRYFDSRDHRIEAAHVMASGALPPAFPAVRIDGEPYWDGGIYSNTPIEAVLDDRPRRDSVIFAVNVWQHGGDEPDSIWSVMTRQKDIQFSSRADNHILRQKQLHRLRHVIRELVAHVPPQARNAAVQELAGWGCGTTMHVVRLDAPRLPDEDHTKDIDFSPEGIRRRHQAGYDDTRRMIERRPWTQAADPIEGVIVHAPEEPVPGPA